MSTSQYLDRYAEPETAISLDPGCRYDHVLCIPAFDEAPDFLEKMTASIRDYDVLVILVVNAPVAASREQLQRTRQLAEELKQQHTLKSRLADNVHLLGGPGAMDLLLVERCSPGACLPGKGGVGLARKIACDMACRFVSEGIVGSPWIHTSDADAQLPPGYLDAVAQLDASGDSAGIYPFRHAPAENERMNQAQALYDLAMDYYVAGLAWARSPWAFHTIGSTLVLNARHYALARGFPAREAGEDFYLLNKLGKIGAIVPLACGPVTLETRASGRVPFGTGPALQKILALENPASDYLYYHPACFVALRCWLEAARALWPQTPGGVCAGFLEAVASQGPEYAGLDTGALLEGLRVLGLEKAMAHGFAHSTTRAVFDRHLHNWFDAFLTLKLVHWLRDNRYPSLPLPEIRGQGHAAFTAVMDGSGRQDSPQTAGGAAGFHFSPS